jgi:ATP-dependent protease HslVU (ClpYQ) peptidase subunit
MTVIAWDGKTLAADRSMSQAGMRRPITKIRTINHHLVGITGNLDDALEMVEWFAAGANPKDFPASAREDQATLITVDRNGVLRTWCKCPYSVTIECEFAAFGSGRDFATMAMHLGKTAAEAVELACVYQTDCGVGIDCLQLESIK